MASSSPATEKVASSTYSARPLRTASMLPSTSFSERNGVRDDDLQQAFGQFGTVTSAKVMMDRDTGRSKGFGFVEMGSDAEAQAAINGMNGQALEGRAIVVNEARPREERPGGFRGAYGTGGGGGGRSGGGGGYGGGGGGGGYGG